MKYIYGPVKSRRLGLSLGLSLTAFKVCNLNCVYCQLGRTRSYSFECKDYVKTGDIISELKIWLQNNPQEAKNLNFVTLSGLGEPTLSLNIGEVISSVKSILGCSVAVLTNSTLLGDPCARQKLMAADLIVPSLDAVTEEIFTKIDRPRESVNLESIINGLIALRKEFKGKIWLEIMLVKGINEGIIHIRKLKEIIERINPDKIQLNSPVRSTAEVGVEPLERNKLEKIRETLGEKAEIV